MRLRWVYFGGATDETLGVNGHTVGQIAIRPADVLSTSIGYISGAQLTYKWHT